MRFYRNVPNDCSTQNETKVVRPNKHTIFYYYDSYIPIKLKNYSIGWLLDDDVVIAVPTNTCTHTIAHIETKIFIQTFIHIHTFTVLHTPEHIESIYLYVSMCICTLDYLN